MHTSTRARAQNHNSSFGIFLFTLTAYGLRSGKLLQGFFVRIIMNIVGDFNKMFINEV